LRFDPVSSRTNFSTVEDPDYFRPQIEEMHAAQQNGFSPEIEAEIANVEWCDLMIWQFPLWWFGLPAALKGWVDRVFAVGRTYGGGRVYQTGYFRGQRALLSLTTIVYGPVHLTDAQRKQHLEDYSAATGTISGCAPGVLSLAIVPDLQCGVHVTRHPRGLHETSRSARKRPVRRRGPVTRARPVEHRVV
jgi:hypothetical protein